MYVDPNFSFRIDLQDSNLYCDKNENGQRLPQSHSLLSVERSSIWDEAFGQSLSYRPGH